VNILEAMTHPRLFQSFFWRPPGGWQSWEAWRCFLAATFALPMDAGQLAIFRRHTGRRLAPMKPFREAHVIAGRRAGKSAISATIVTHVATFRNYDDVLMPGEVGVAAVIAASKRQAEVVLTYIRAYFREIPVLKAMVVGETSDSITLNNGVRIEVLAADARRLRGHTLIIAILDETAHMGAEDSSNSAEAVVAAIRPAMVTVPESLLISITTPHAKRGLVWNTFRRHYGKDDSGTLIWKASTTEMNPAVDREVIARAWEEDPIAAASEFGGEFRNDLEGYVSREVVESCVVRGRKELPPQPGISYRAFVDPSGGLGDSMVLVIGHSEGGRAVIDFLCERAAPFSPDVVTDEFVMHLQRYDVHTVTGDAYAGEWPRQKFRAGGVEYRVAEKHRGDLYLQTLPRLTGRRVELPDNDRMISQFCNLERSTAKSGRDSIDHPSGGHDDVSNAAAGLVVELVGGAGPIRLTLLDWRNKIYEKFLATGKTWEEQQAEGESKKLPVPVARVPEAGDCASLVKVAAENARISEQTCPECGGVGCVVRRGELYHRNSCGHEWEINPSMVTKTGQRTAGMAAVDDRLRFPGGNIPRWRN
jgi:hypothetical protein